MEVTLRGPRSQMLMPSFHRVARAGVTQIDRVVEAVEETLKGHCVQLLAKKALPRLDLPKVRRNKWVVG